MNWYSRYTGDYMRDTAHLSLTEHGAYTVLLDHYYSTKEPLPKDFSALIRICRAYEDYEKDAVKSVADKYFPTGSDGLRHNKRADIELSKAEYKSEKARQSAALRWDKKGNANAYANASKTHKRSLCSPQPQPQPHPDTTNQNPDDDICLPDKSGKPKPKTFKQWTEEDFLAECNRVHDEKHILPTDYEGTKFYLYWSEPDTRGKMKLAKQKTWDTERRMITWRDNNFGGK